MSKFALKNREASYILSEEAALDQIVRMLEYYDIDVEQTADEGRPTLERALESLTGYVRRGYLEVSFDTNGKITVTQHVKGDPEPIVYPEIAARHKLAMDRAKGDGGYTRLYALMGSLSGLGAGAIEKLPARDLAVVEALGLVFLAA